MYGAMISFLHLRTPKRNFGKPTNQLHHCYSPTKPVTPQPSNNTDCSTEKTAIKVKF